MKRDLSIWQLAGVTFTAVLGTILHFLYDWTGSVLVTPFSAANESTWEHMKLLFFPMVLFACAQSFFFREEYDNFWCIKLIGIVFGVTLIPVLFYTLGGTFGELSGWMNVLIFFVAAGGAYYLEYRLFKRNTLSCLWKIMPIFLLLLIAAAFVLFTYLPPNIPLFQDPITGGYGL